MSATIELSPVQVAAKELNTAVADLDELEREASRRAKAMSTARERVAVARRTYDALVSNVRLSAATAAAYGNR